jgi:AbrB family looped-hinge helix DNA binding protein
VVENRSTEFLGSGVPRNIDEKGRVRVPAHFRKILDVKPNDTLVFYLAKDGYLVVKKKEDDEEEN